MVEFKYIALMAIGSSAALAVIVKSIADAVVRYAEVKRSSYASANERVLGARLERIESAIEAVSLEVERIGELHRFSAQLAVGRSPTEGVPAELQLPKPGTTGRVITPH